MRIHRHPPTTLLLAILLMLSCLATAMVVAPQDARAATGDTWTQRTGASNDGWGSIAYGNGTFVAVAYEGSNGRVMTSPDGVTWTQRTAVATSQWRAVTFGEGIFVAVARMGSTQVMTSPDGINWTARTAAAANQWYDVTYGEGIFVAVAESGTGNRVMTSPDGVNWTTQQSAADVGWYGVTHGNETFVAVGTQNYVMTSPDGVTWTQRSAANALGWYDVTYGNGKFVAVGYMTNATAGVMTSTNGAQWTLRNAAGQRGWSAITFGGGLFAATASTYPGVLGPSDQNLMTSPDGDTWTLRSAGPVGTTFSGITYGDGLFAAISSSYGERVLTSGAMFPAVPAPPTAVAGNAEATVSVAPGSGGAWAVTSYTVTAEPGGRTCTITVPASSCTVTGLTNGTAYTFSAMATNVAGTSLPSAPSAAVSPAAPPVALPPTLPDAPTDLVVTSGSASARARWAAASDTSSPITYTVTAAPRSAMLRSDLGLIRSSTEPTGLAVDRNGNAYTIDERAQTVIKVSAQGVRSTLGTTGTSPRGPVVDADGNVYVVDYGDGVVRRIAPSGSTSVHGQAGPSTISITIDAQRNLYTSNRDGWVTKISPAGTAATLGQAGAGAIAVDSTGVVVTLAVNPFDSGRWGYVYRLPPGGQASRFAPVALSTGRFAIDPQGNVLMGLIGNARLARVTPGGAVSTLASGRPGTTEGSWAVAADALGNAYIGSFSFTATTIRPTVERIAPDGSVLPVAQLGGQPRAVTVGPEQAVYWAANGVVGRSIPLVARTCTVSVPAGSTSVPSCLLAGLVNGAEYDVTVRATNSVGTGPASAPVIARPVASLQPMVASVAGSPAGTTVLTMRTQSTMSTVAAVATPLDSRQQNTSAVGVRQATMARRSTCTQSGLRARCVLDLRAGRWRVALTERRSGAVVAQAARVLRVRPARAGAVTG